MTAVTSEQHRQLARQLAGATVGTEVTCGGWSMAPTVKLGERLPVYASEDVRAGDVVAFETGDIYILHRVVFKLPVGGWFVHQGDAPGCRPGVSHVGRVLGRAKLPRRLHGPKTYAAAAWLVLQKAWKRRGRLKTGRGLA